MMQMHFINGTPEVEGNRMRVELEVNESTANLLCELLTQERLDSPMVANCEQKCLLCGFTYMYIRVCGAAGLSTCVYVCSCVHTCICSWVYLKLYPTLQTS